MNRRIAIDDGVTKARYGLILAKFEDEGEPAMRLVGMWDYLEKTKQMAASSFPEFRPGMALIQDTVTGEIVQAYNWNHDCLMWTRYVARSESRYRSQIKYPPEH
jgi:hypothetical protein